MVEEKKTRLLQEADHWSKYFVGRFCWMTAPKSVTWKFGVCLAAETNGNHLYSTSKPEKILRLL
jgi:hypothetical protein